MMILTQRSTLGRRTLWMTSFLFSCALWGAACSESGGGPDPGTNKPDIDAPDSYGDTCIDDDDVCVDGMECFSYGSEVDDRFCSMQCVNDDSCPEESSCLSLNAADGLIKLCVPNDLCIDPDGDEYGSGPGCKGPDCDQTNSLINPGAPELCDGIDNNCDGLIDNDTVDARETCDTGLMGVCNDGWYVCRDANLVCEPNIQPGERQEICDGLDNDCDGLVDESVEEDIDGQNYVTGIGRPCGNPEDVCFGGYQICNSEARQLECDDPVEPLDIPDYCTGRDDNCNGEVDEDANDPDNLLGTPCYDGIGTCRAAATWSCDPDDPEGFPVCPAKAREENATTEVCDYTDNDCDGVVDNGFRNADGVYDQIENCGQCGNDCNERFGGDPAARGLKVECKVTGSQARCASECLPGRYDLDKVPANGCEFEPDLDAIYVAKEVRDGTQGEDTNNCGTFDAPCRTIAHAISRASSSSKPRVRVAEGIFKEAVTLSNGISVMGGHSSRNWILDPAANTTTLQGGIAMGNHVTTVRVESITSTTEFSGFTIDARDAQPGGNSYGIYIKDSNNSLTVKDNIVIAGRGGVGTAAGNGSSGQTGAHGANGEDRRNFHSNCSHSSGTPLLAGGAGGENSCGGTNTSGGSAVSITRCPTNTNGQPINLTSTVGAAGSNTQGGAGGVSSNHTSRSTIVNDVYGCEGTDAGVSSPGRDGGSGSNGSAGSAGSGAGSVSGGHWQGVTGGAGGSGTHGSGGGGAGSSGGAQEENGAVHYGPTGGGGGAGGCGGNGGTGGHAGGASFGIFVSFSGNSSNVPSITNNEITRGLGGRGGAGGAGGAGGSGGAGGEGGEMKATPENWTRCGQDGQRGGTGGTGGHGGGGGGGVGGASFDIATGGNSNNAVDAYQGANTYTQGSGDATGGQGGAGGTSIGNAGAAGAQGASGNFRRF